jgi:hypothetical protein
MKNQILTTILLSILFTGCVVRQNVIVQFTKVENEKTVSPRLKEFLKTTQNPSIVLRVPGGANNTTSNQSNSKGQIYNTIEKSLLRNGFVVRDRALFNEVLEKTIESDYSKIFESTKTDLILELISVDLNVEYKTNKYVKQNGNGESNIFGCNREYTFSGASIEFRVILLQKNEFIGSYKLNFSPCVEGCPYIYEKDNMIGVCDLYDEKRNSLNSRGFESVELSQLEAFISKSMDEFIMELKN